MEQIAEYCPDLKSLEEGAEKELRLPREMITEELKRQVPQMLHSVSYAMILEKACKCIYAPVVASTAEMYAQGQERTYANNRQYENSE